jgi:hypothetical protein
MAEREGFEPPIDLRLWLISSQFLSDLQPFALCCITENKPFVFNG